MKNLKQICGTAMEENGLVKCYATSNYECPHKWEMPMYTLCLKAYPNNSELEVKSEEIKYDVSEEDEFNWKRNI